MVSGLYGNFPEISKILGPEHGFHRITGQVLFGMG
jgi:hypothetical protein